LKAKVNVMWVEAKLITTLLKKSLISRYWWFGPNSKNCCVFKIQLCKVKFTATFWSQVLAQLHGIPAEEDEQDEQQEDAQGIAGSQEHRRPRSAGHLTEPSSSTSTHKIGRPPLAETTANNKLGLKVSVYGIVIS